MFMSCSNRYRNNNTEFPDVNFVGHGPLGTNSPLKHIETNQLERVVTTTNAHTHRELESVLLCARWVVS